MPTYAVGDVQGCYHALCCLLQQVSFDREHDNLWLIGDLVNRGPASLEVLRLIRSLGERAKIVLGNHDLHLLAIAYGARQLKSKDTVGDILQAPDRDELLDWLRGQPLLYTDREIGYTMVHAGIPAQWSLSKAHQLAAEVEAELKSGRIGDFLASMYGDSPLRWRDTLTDGKRLRTITNYLTRMRFCTAEGKLDLETTDCKVSNRPGYAPWFSYPNARLDNQRILFGHWAALEGESDSDHFHALDSGCVWGGRLTAMRLEDGHRFYCDCADGLSGSPSR